MTGDTGDVLEIDDDELAELALAADPDVELDADAVPFFPDETHGDELLPAWYMPAPRSFRRTPGRTVAAVSFVVALVALNGAGLCVTYGMPEIAW
ncbi:MAG: hypothetical protein ABWZ42_05295 [Ilumatobacteraceae bacterium]